MKALTTYILGGSIIIFTSTYLYNKYKSKNIPEGDFQQ